MYSQYMKSIVLMLISTLFIIGLSGCNDKTSLSDNGSETGTDNGSVTGTAKLGNLADANVAISKIEDDSSITVLGFETTSDGTTLADIGKFDLHLDELDDNTFYLYGVEGGKDWDANDTGTMDAHYTVNKGLIRSIALGRDIKAAGNNFTVSYATELLYENVESTLRYDFNKSTFQALLLKNAAKVVTDVNNEGTVDMQDILTFNPQKDASKLVAGYQRQLQTILDALHAGETPVLTPPYILGSYVTAGYARAVALSGDETKAYVADEDNGLVVIDISDPVHPAKLGSYDTAGSAYDVTLSSDGTKAYVADNSNGLVVINISDPAHPVKLGAYDTTGQAMSVTLSGDGTKAYVADTNDGLVVIDISDPAQPAKLGLYSDGYAYGVTLSSDGSKAYVADNSNGLAVIDISDPAHPARLGSYNTAGYAHDIALSSDGTKAYVADNFNALVVIDISDPANPAKLGSCDMAGGAYGVTLSSDGTKAYVADWFNGLVVIDISDPANPVKLGSYDMADSAFDIILSSDESKAYVANYGSGLVVIDLTSQF